MNLRLQAMCLLVQPICGPCVKEHQHATSPCDLLVAVIFKLVPPRAAYETDNTLLSGWYLQATTVSLVSLRDDTSSTLRRPTLYSKGVVSLG